MNRLCSKRIIGMMLLVRARLIYQMLRAFIVLAPSVEGKLRFAKALGAYAVANSFGVYADQKVEKYLITCVAKILDLSPFRDEPTKGVVHVITEPYLTGGHTRIVERFATYPSLGEAEVLITGRVRTGTLEGFRRRNLCTHEICIIGRTILEQITDIVMILSRFRIVILHIHPDDVVSTVAAGLVKKIGTNIRVAFYNHADHLFSFGYYVADRVLEITCLGWSKRDVRKVAGKSSFVGIPIEVAGTEYADDIERKGLRLISVGAAYKYTPSQGLSFFSFLDQLYTIKEAVMTVVGVEERYSKEWVCYKEKYRDRLRLLGPIPFDELGAELARASIYIDSIPLSGGMAFPQGMIACGGALGLHLPVAGFSPADAIRVATIGEIIDQVVDFSRDPGALHDRQAAVRKSVLTAHSDEAVEIRLYQSIFGEKLIAPLWETPLYADYFFFEKRFVEANVIDKKFLAMLPRSLRRVIGLL